MKIRIHNTAVALTLGALVLGGGLAQAAVTLPPIHKDGPGAKAVFVWPAGVDETHS